MHPVVLDSHDAATNVVGKIRSHYLETEATADVLLRTSFHNAKSSKVPVCLVDG